MCREIEKFVNEKGEVRFAEGKANGEAKSIFNLMKNAGMDFDMAAKMVGCSEEEAHALKPLVDAMKEADNQ